MHEFERILENLCLACMLAFLMPQVTAQGKIVVAVKVVLLPFFPFLSSGPAPANPLLGTSATMYSPTLCSKPLTYMNHPEEEKGVCRYVCASLARVYGAFSVV